MTGDDEVNDTASAIKKLMKDFSFRVYMPGGIIMPREKSESLVWEIVKLSKMCDLSFIAVREE
jgi:hypothetical protein